MEVVKLRNGTEEVKPLVAVVMMHLNALMRDEPNPTLALPKMLALYDLVEISKDPAYPSCFGPQRKLLLDLMLVKEQADGTLTMDQSTRNVVQSALTYDESTTNIRLLNPVA